MPWKGYLWQHDLKAYLHTVESLVWGSEEFSCWSWKSMTQLITCFLLQTRQVFEQQQDLTILLLRQWMIGTRGGAVREGVGGSILISSSSSSVTLLSMKSMCSASPFTAKKTCIQIYCFRNVQTYDFYCSLFNSPMFSFLHEKQNKCVLPHLY